MEQEVINAKEADQLTVSDRVQRQVQCQHQLLDRPACEERERGSVSERKAARNADDYVEQGHKYRVSCLSHRQTK